VRGWTLCVKKNCPEKTENFCMWNEIL
jgi:hypothetical protein